MIVETVEITVGIVLIRICLCSGTVFSIPYFRNPVKFVVHILYFGTVSIGHGCHFTIVVVVRIACQGIIARLDTLAVAKVLL